MSMRLLLLLLPVFSAGLCPAEEGSGRVSPEEEPPLPAETQKSLDSLETMLKELARTLESIVDADSAGRHAAAVEYLIQELYATDYAALEGGDEEVIAAGLEALFARIDRNMVRLDDADFYGNVDLKRVFGADDSAVLQVGQGCGTPDAGCLSSEGAPGAEKGPAERGAEGLRQGVLEEPVEQVQGEPREGVQEESVEQVQGESREEVQEEPVEQVQGEPREEVQKKSVEQVQGESREEVQKKSVEQVQGEPREGVQEDPVGQAQGEPRVETQGDSGEELR